MREESSTTVRRKQVRPDGTIRGEFKLHRDNLQERDGMLTAGKDIDAARMPPGD